MSRRVSDTSLKALRVPAQERRICVDRNLYFRIRPNGSRSWAVRQMQQGKRSLVSIGTFPSMLLAAAKKRAATMTDGGVDTALTVARAVELYIERHVARLRPASRRVVGYYLETLTSFHGTRKLAALRRADYVAVAESYRKRGKLPSANRCASQLHTFCAFAVDQGWLEMNPLHGLRSQAAGGRETARTRTLTEDEVRWLWNVSPENHRRLFRALMLTGCRIGELRAATWSMVRGDVLALPAEITKSNREHVLPLSKMAQQALGARGEDNTLLFPMSGNSTVHAALERCKVGFTPHDIRRTVYTVLSKLGVAPHVIERVVNHAPAKLVGVYNRYDYSAEMRAALERLAEWVGSVTSDDGAPASE
jgi:integrase